MLYKNFMKLDLSKSHFGISSERQLHQHNAILSIQEFIIMRTNPLTDHCAKQREAHTSFSCYWPLLKSPFSIYIHTYDCKMPSHWIFSQCSLGINICWKTTSYVMSIFWSNFVFASNIADHFVVHYGLTKISCYLFEQQLEL